MKRKILFLAIVGLLCMSAVVYAGSLWGQYKGNDIIRLTVNGSAVKVSDVPAINYNNRTMVPIYLLQQAGINYSWDQKNKTVDIESSSPSSSENVVGIDWRGIFGHLRNYHVSSLSMLIDSGIDGITANYNGTSKTITNSDYNEILKSLAYSDATYFQIHCTDGVSYTFTSKTVRNFYEGKITEAQLNASVTTNGAQTSGSTATSGSGTTTSTTYPKLYSNDLRTYLGKLTTNTFDSDSVFNQFGIYGSKYQTNSIWNQFGTYGSDFSSESAFNKFTTTPPAIVLSGKIIGYVTMNSTIANGVTPAGLYDYIKNLGY